MSDSRISYATNSHNNTHYSGNTHSFNTTNSFNTDTVLNLSVNNVTATDEKCEILAWLSPLEPRIRHQDISTRRADSVGEWLLQTDEFQRWCYGAEEDGEEHATLFCFGGPAVGKTFFSSLVVDRLCNRAKEENIAVACFYVDFAARQEQTPTSMLGSLLKQIVGGLEKAPDEISQTFQDYKRVIGGKGLRMPEIVKMLQTVTSLQPTFICVDALDECVEGHRAEVLDSLRQILDKSPNTRIFLTGRQHIRSEIERYLGGKAEILRIIPNSDDISGYIRMRLSKDTLLGAMDSSLEAEIIKGIAENIPETFLLISLTLDAILRETTTYHRRKRLRAMSDGLDLNDVYGATLERIQELGGEKTRLGMAALMWISHSERLLQIEELFHALAIEIGSTDINSESIPSVETLLSCCLGLVVVDRETSVVRLIHFTLQEYLHSCPNLFGSAHAIMAETCLTYLNFQAIKEISPTLFALPRSTPFLRYSSLYWGTHARREVSREVVSLTTKLFSQIESHISTKLLLADLIGRTGRYIGDIPINDHLVGFTGLHCASVFGIVEIATTLMGQSNCNFNKRDFLGITPLIWAAICGQEELVKRLLEKQAIIPDKPDKYFRRTALTWAAGKGHEGVVRLLLGRASAKLDGTDRWWGKTPRVMNIVLGKRYVDPNRPDKYGQTAILLAAEEGHSGVVRQLLERKDVKPDVADGYGRTPLLCAFREGREGVVELLLERRDVSIDKPDTNGETPLLLAARCGYEGVVGQLLGREGAKPGLPNMDGQTPFSLACENGREGVAKLLLERKDVNPDMPDRFGRTPLSFACTNGCEGVAKLLLERKDVNPDMPDKSGRTPLSFACGNGRDGVVKLLLAREDINPDMQSKYGQTPLSFACESGCEVVVKLLLGREDINPDMPDMYGQTPLSFACENGREGVVKLLLEWKDVNPDTPDKDGRTPLSLACKDGREGVVKLLLGREDINPDMPDRHGQTPLSLACENGREGVMKLLLERNDVNPNMPDRYGQTPLWLACQNGREGVVKLLLERKDVNPNTPDRDGRTPLSLACKNGREGVVKLLLGREDINPNMPDRYGQTPLSLACENGREGVVKLLLERNDVNPDTPDRYGRTPLSLACKRGHEGVVKLLLERNDVNPNMPDRFGQTPLWFACQNGHEGGVKLLLERKDVNPDMPDEHGRTPLSRAAQLRHRGVVKLLQTYTPTNPSLA